MEVFSNITGVDLVLAKIAVDPRQKNLWNNNKKKKKKKNPSDSQEDSLCGPIEKAPIAAAAEGE